MRHSIEVLQGMSAAGAMQIVSAIANGHTGWNDIKAHVELNDGRMSVLMRVLKRKGVVVQREGYQLTPDAVTLYEAALQVQAGYEAMIVEACDVQP